MDNNFGVKVLVGHVGQVLELQPASLSVMITSFFRDWAAKRTACSTSSGASCGYLRTISAIDPPLAMSSRINSTLIRVPLMQGLPASTAEFDVMRSNIAEV